MMIIHFQTIKNYSKEHNESFSRKTNKCFVYATLVVKANQAFPSLPPYIPDNCEKLKDIRAIHCGFCITWVARKTI